MGGSRPGFRPDRDEALKPCLESRRPLARNNVHARCNLGARHRWGIESSFLIEKRHGYPYEHSFSYDWKAMKGYHYLMRLGHFINVPVQNSARLAWIVVDGGEKVGHYGGEKRTTLTHKWRSHSGGQGGVKARVTT